MNGDIHDSTIMLFITEKPKPLVSNSYLYLSILTIYLSTVALGVLVLWRIV